MIHAIIPAHNEQARIAACIASLQNQTHQIDKITVVCDNCIDETPLIAYEMGAEVFCTKDNRNKKAGALNAYLSTLFEEEDRKIFVVDADSEVSPRFVEEAMKHPNAAVGGIFLEDGKNGLLGRMQGAEYIRYAREIARKQGAAKVLTGTSTVTSLSWLRNIAELRGSKLPGIKGEVYNTLSITEDFEMTLSLKTLGIKTVSPKGCTVVTETMPDLAQLWNQRTRWQRGAVDTIKLFGITRVTLPYIGQQAMMLIGILMITLLWSLTAYLLLIGFREISPIWLCVGLIFYIERIVSIWRGQWQHKLSAILILPDLFFDMFISLVNISVWVKILTRREAKWGLKTIDEGSK